MHAKVHMSLRPQQVGPLPVPVSQGPSSEISRWGFALHFWSGLSLQGAAKLQVYPSLPQASARAVLLAIVVFSWDLRSPGSYLSSGAPVATRGALMGLKDGHAP